MRKEDSRAEIADLRWFYRSVRGRHRAAAIVLTFDVVLFGSILMSMIVCPIWILAESPEKHNPPPRLGARPGEDFNSSLDVVAC